MPRRGWEQRQKNRASPQGPAVRVPKISPAKLPDQAIAVSRTVKSLSTNRVPDTPSTLKALCPVSAYWTD